MSPTVFTRPAVRGLVLVLLASSISGCAWFRKEPEYLSSPESRPLEVPPDLAIPASSAALQVPAASAAASVPGEAPPTATQVGTSFNIADSSENAFRRVGLALARIDGVASSKPVSALNSHEVSFRGSSFLVRLTAEGEGVRVDAISPEGAVLSGGPAGELLAALRTRLQ